MWHKTLLWQYRWNYRCFWQIHSKLNTSPVTEMCEKCKIIWWAVPLMHLFLVSPWMWYPLMVHGAQSVTMCEHTPSHILFASDVWVTVSILHRTISWNFYFPPKCDICHGWCRLFVSMWSLTTTHPTAPVQVIDCIDQVTFSTPRLERFFPYIWQTGSCWSHNWKVTYNIHLQIFSFHHGLQWSSLALLNTQRTLLISRKHHI